MSMIGVTCRTHSKSETKYFNRTMLQVKYSFSCLHCPRLYAEMDEKTGDALMISEPIPLPALNVRQRHWFSLKNHASKFSMKYFVPIIRVLIILLEPFLLTCFRSVSYQIKYNFSSYQKSEDKIKIMREKFNDPKWRPPPLQIVNVSLNVVEQRMIENKGKLQRIWS